MITPESVKFIRQKIDKVTRAIAPAVTSQEKDLAIISMKRGFMFLGLILKDMDQPNPYPESHNKNSKVIEPTADTSPETFNFDAEDEIGRVKELRAEIETISEDLKRMYVQCADTPVKPECKPFFFSHVITAVMAIEEGKMWLGQELARIKTRDEQSKV